MSEATTTPVEGAAIVCPPETLSVLRALVQLGVLYSMDKLVCYRGDCEDCPDRMIELMKALYVVGQDEGPFHFEWGSNSLALVVRDPISIAEHAPSIGETIAAIEKKGGQVKHELAL